jgi:hypothetical protein
MNRSPLIVAVALLAPLVACAAVTPFRDDIANTNAALGLVLIVVGVASTGQRAAGVIAALSSAVWFDFFLTEPYQRFTIADRDDIETAVLLTVVGLGVTEIALWGRRQQARASSRAGYLDGVVSAARIVATGSASATVVAGHVARQIADVLDIDGCRFDPSPGHGTLPRLGRDGSVTRHGHAVDVDRDGLPVDDEIELLIESGGVVRGRFLLTAATAVSRPDLERRIVAVALAQQAGAALSTPAAGQGPPPTP